MLSQASLTIDVNGVIIRADNGLKDMLGYAQGELVGCDISSVLSQTDAATLRSVLARSNSGGPVHGLKTALVMKDGLTRVNYLSFYPMQDREGRVYSTVLTFDRGPHAPAPHIVSNEFQKMFRFSNDAVAITDPNGSIIDVNQAFIDIYGYSRDELLGRNPRLIRSDRSTAELYRQMWADILDPSIGYWRGEIINRRKDGAEVPVLLTISAIRDEAGEVVSFLGVALDMAVEKELERLKKMYIDYIIHDMRGPLTTIMLNSDLLQMQTEGVISEKARKKLDAIKHSSQRLSYMTSDILDYSRLATGARLMLDRRSVLLRDIFREAAMPFESAGKTFTVNGVNYAECALDDTEVYVDPEKLGRVIYNLLGNAFKYASRFVAVSIGVEGRDLMLTVEDDGRGISRKDAQRIFEAFYQADGGIRSGSAGLGLSIVKSFVEAHGGRVWSEPGAEKGARFLLRIPDVRP